MRYMYRKMWYELKRHIENSKHDVFRKKELMHTVENIEAQIVKHELERMEKESDIDVDKHKYK